MKAYLVIGPESSGTRVLTKALIAAGCYGQSGHGQAMDGPNWLGAFDDCPETIVFRRSVPHAGMCPDISDLVKRMQQCGYVVTILVVVRDLWSLVHSQVERKHARNLEHAEHRIGQAWKHIMFYCAETSAQVIMVSYESLFLNGATGLLTTLGLNPRAQVPVFTNEDAKYYG